MTHRTELMLRLTRSLALIAPVEPLPRRLCEAFVHVVEGRGGTIALGFTTSERMVLCATTDDTARYEDAQDLVRQGPSLDAFRTGRIVTSATAADARRRWPALAEVTDSLPPTSVHAIPMRPSASVTGVLTVHHDERAALAHTSAELQFLSDAIGAAIIGDLPSEDAESRLWSERDLVSQATGMVLAQLRLTPHDALAVLRAHAFAQATSLREVARRVVDRELDFSGRPEPRADR